MQVTCTLYLKRKEDIANDNSQSSDLELEAVSQNDTFFYLDFFHNNSWITGLQGKGEGISLTPYYHFHPLHRHLGISQAITVENLPLHIGSSLTQTGNLWFASPSR